MYPFGVQTRAQLLAAGIPASTVDDRCRNGTYHRLLPGVYCLDEPTGIARCAAITEWLPTATLSHRTAGWLRGLLPEPELFEATVPKAVRRGTPRWLRLYRRDLAFGVLGEALGMPTTNAAATLFDCAAVLPLADAERLIDEQIGRMVSADEMLALCGQRGSPRVRKLITGAAVHAASEPEPTAADRTGSYARSGSCCATPPSMSSHTSTSVRMKPRTSFGGDGS